MNGMRRPHRERLLSDTEPSRGSATAICDKADGGGDPDQGSERPSTAV